MGAPRDLEELVRAELFSPAPESVRPLSDEMRRRHGDAANAVLFYGSCLRKGTTEGVLDFYLLVDDYRAAYRSRGSRALAAAARALPPNVHFLEVEGPDGPLRAKYALLSAGDYARGAAGGGLRASTWARFCQPAVAVWTRDEAARDAVAAGACASVRTALRTLAPLLPPGEPFDAARFWQTAFRETYAAEMRPETPATVRGVHAAAPERYEQAARLGLEELARRGEVEIVREGDGLLLRWPGGAARARRSWTLRRRAAKALYLVGLGKSGFTFGDWLPYALWKLERHSGSRLVPSERQRRHPFVFGWPLLLRALWRRDFG